MFKRFFKRNKKEEVKQEVPEVAATQEQQEEVKEEVETVEEVNHATEEVSLDSSVEVKEQVEEIQEIKEEEVAAETEEVETIDESTEVVEEEIVEEVVKEKTEEVKVSLFERLKQGLTKAKQGITDKVDQVLKSYTKVDEDLLEEIEEILITADVGVETTMYIIDKLTDAIKTKKITAHHNRKTKKSFIVKTGIVLVTLLCFIFLTFNEIDNIKNTTNKPQLLANEKKDGVAKTQIPKAVDLGLSVMWADRNVEVKSLEHTGDFFKWGGVRPYLEDGENTVGKIYNISNTKYDVAHVCLGGKWRLPTKKEFEELLSKCSYKLDDSKDGGVSFISKSNGNKIFFPSTELDPEKGYRGYYWTGTGYNSEQSWGFIFGKETG